MYLNALNASDGPFVCNFLHRRCTNSSLFSRADEYALRILLKPSNATTTRASNQTKHGREELREEERFRQSETGETKGKETESFTICRHKCGRERERLRERRDDDDDYGERRNGGIDDTVQEREKSERYEEEKRTETGDDIDEREEEERGEKNEWNFTENALEKHSKDEERTRRIGLEKEEGRRRECVWYHKRRRDERRGDDDVTTT